MTSNSETPDRQIEQKFTRLWEAVGAKSDSELAKALGVIQQTVSSARQRHTIPSGWIVKISEKYSICSDWLLFGEGPKYRRERGAAAPASGPASPLNRELLRQILAGVKQGLALRRLALPPDKEADLVELLYDHYAKTGESPEAQTVERYLRLVA